MGGEINDFESYEIPWLSVASLGGRDGETMSAASCREGSLVTITGATTENDAFQPHRVTHEYGRIAKVPASPAY